MTEWLLSTHCLIGLPSGGTGNFLYVVSGKPELFLPSVVPTPPRGEAGEHRSETQYTCGHTKTPTHIQIEYNSNNIEK